MKYALKYLWSLVFILTCSISVSAQFDNFYKSANAIIVNINADSSIVHREAGATLIMQKNSSRLTVNLQIPGHILKNYNPEDTIVLDEQFLFKLTIKLAHKQIMKNVTSTRALKTRGYATLNNITQRLKIEYSPILSGTEKTDYNMFLRVTFDAADFDLQQKSKFTRFTITINNAPVNFI